MHCNTTPAPFPLYHDDNDMLFKNTHAIKVIERKLFMRNLFDVNFKSKCMCLHFYTRLVISCVNCVTTLVSIKA